MKETRKQLEIKTIKYGFENFYIAIDRIYATLSNLNDAAKKLEEYIIQVASSDNDNDNDNDNRCENHKNIPLDDDREYEYLRKEDI